MNNDVLKQIFARYNTAYAVSQVLINEVAQLAANINNTDTDTELQRLKNAIQEFARSIETVKPQQ